jgi:hypothetical protein
VTELFPTAVRGSATSWASTSSILGRTASLGVAALLLKVVSQAVTTTVLAAGSIVGVIMVATLFPDTHGRELEETSGELDIDPDGNATPTAVEPAPPTVEPLLT